MITTSLIVSRYQEFLARGVVSDMTWDQFVTADSLAFVAGAYVGSALADAAAMFVASPSIVTLEPLAMVTRVAATPSFSKKRREFLTLVMKELYETLNSR